MCQQVGLNAQFAAETAESDILRAALDTVRKQLKRLNRDCTQRAEKWGEQLLSYAELVARQFDCYMNHKGCSGTIEFDHHTKKLIIKSQTNNEDEHSQCSDVRQLSGGERSYTTLCLLMALGHVIECPFRIMDEYDVFLDQIARKVTLNLLQDYALRPEQRGRQFVIITPQSLSDIRTTAQTRIHRMQPPVRSSAHGAVQTTL